MCCLGGAERSSLAAFEGNEHYPTAVPLLGAFAPLGHGPGDFPIAERAAREVLSLPLHPHLSAEDQGRVAEVLAAAML